LNSLGAIYRRVSTDHQHIENQDEKTAGYAKLKGIDVPSDLVFEDEDVSGSIELWDRPHGSMLKQALEHGWAEAGQALGIPPKGVRHLIVTKLDRLGRNAGNMLQVYEWCKTRNIVLHIVDLGGESITSQGYSGKLVFGVIALFAEFEREMIRDRIQQKLDSKFSKGELIGTVPFGFDAVDGVLSPNAIEQAVLHRMADLRAGGMSYGRIGRWLNGERVPTKTGIVGGWQSGNVAKVLNSRHTRKILSQMKAAA